MAKHKNGSVDSFQTVKAGCGIRFDPEVLDEDCGFDFSKAKKLKPHQSNSEDAEEKPDIDKEKDS